MMSSPALSMHTAFDAQAYSVKRHGLSLGNCDSEPVQTPGCVQAHGALLVLRLSDLCISQASDNCHAVLGHGHDELLGQPVRTLIGANGQDRVRAMLASEPTECNPLYVLTLAAASTGLQDAGLSPALDITLHTINGVAILEFEAISCTAAKNPDYYGLVRKTVARLQSAQSLRQFCDSVTQEVRELCAMDRVMVYKFHADGHGEVFAESRIAGLPSWMGLHYPAEDIPKLARDVFTKIWLRPIPDICGGLAEMVPLVNPDTGRPLEMTYCALRGVSIIASEFFRNMGVSATLTMPIRRNESLWGLITCHHYAGPHHAPYQVRAACEFLAQVVSLQHHAAEDKEHDAYRLKLQSVHQQLLAIAVDGGGLAALTSGTLTLRDGIDCGGAALFHLDRWWRVGKTPNDEQLDDLGAWLTAEKFSTTLRPLYATDSLVRDYPPAAAFVEVASGVLAMPIALGGRSLMMWFRPETLQSVNWAGDPHDKPVVLGPNGPRLTPRRSFRLFVESVQDRSLPWLSVEIEAATALRLVVMEMVVDRAARLTSLNAELARSNEELDAFVYVASHDLKAPLRGIAQYANQLLDDAGEGNAEIRSKLDRLKHLTMRMDSLLNSLLRFSRVGRTELELETVHLDEVLAEASEMVSSRTAAIKVFSPRRLPTVWGNRAWCREILVNLLSNAKTFNDKTVQTIEAGFIDVAENHPRPGAPQASTGQRIFFVSDNGIGIERRYFGQVFKLFKRLHGREEYGGGGGAGLTIVRKLVERQGGQVWLDSRPRQGTTVYFTLPRQGTQ